MTTGQSPTAGKAASGAEGGDSFAALLAGVTEKTEGPDTTSEAATNVFSTQLPLFQATPTPADPTLIPNGAAVNALLAEGGDASGTVATAQPGTQGAAIAPATAAVTTPAIAASTQPAAQVNTGTETESAEGGKTPEAQASGPDNALALPASDETATAPSANGDPAAKLAAAGNTVPAAPQTATALAMPSLQTPEAAPVAEAAEPVQSATVIAEPEASSSQSARHAPAGAQSAAAGQQSGTANTATPVIDAAAAPKADVAQPTATPQTPVADMCAPNAAADTPRAQQTSPALQSAPAATIQVYQRIIERADGKAQRFEVRLDPAELGRVDVRIEIGADKKVHAVLAAHDSAALSDLMRGHRALERALSEAGIDLSDKGVRFELASENGRNGANAQRDSDGRPAQNNVWRNFDAPVSPDIAEAAAPSRPAWASQRLDLVA